MSAVAWNLFAEPAQVATDSPTIVLRPYQEQAQAAVFEAHDKGLERAVIVLATGCGKTTIFSSLIGAMDKKTLVLAHRDELLTQARNRIALQNPSLGVGVEGGSRRCEPGADVVVAGVQTIGRADCKRLSWFDPKLLIIDECHHAPAASYQHVMRNVGAYEGKCFTLGVTATDHRLDNKRLHGGGGIFEEVVFRYSIRDAISEGWLCTLRGYRVATKTDLSKVKTTGGDYNQAELQRAVNTEVRNEAAFTHWREVAHDRRTVVFCTGVDHSKEVARMFCENGVIAESVDGGMKQDLRDAAMARFRSGKTQVLCNVELVTEGVDVPEINCVLLLRPTKSWALFTQMVGRGLRLSEGKDDCIVLDVVDVTSEHSVSDSPGVAGLVGMPSHLDLQGNTIDEALKKFEKMSGGAKSAAFARQISFDELDTGIQEVDLLAELAIPEDLKGATRLAWLKVSDGRYLLNCGSSRDGGEQYRTATIVVDQLGRCFVALASQSRNAIPIVIDEIRDAFFEADRLVKAEWPDCAGIVASRAAWRDRPPTDGQKALMTRLKVPADILTQITTMGQASTVIDSYKQKRGWGSR